RASAGAWSSSRRASAPPGAPAPGRSHSLLAFAALPRFSSSWAAPWPRSWGPFVLVDAILTPTREPSLLSSQVQQGPGHPPVLAAQAEALDQAQGEENEGGGEADRPVGRHEPDEGRRHAHAGQRDDEGVLPAHLVAEPAEDERPQRSDEETDGEDCHRAEKGRDRVTLLGSSRFGVGTRLTDLGSVRPSRAPALPPPTSARGAA